MIVFIVERVDGEGCFDCDFYDKGCNVPDIISDEFECGDEIGSLKIRIKEDQ